MKNIDVKSILIGALLTSTIFLGVAATSPTDKWDDKQQWEVATEANLRISREVVSEYPSNGRGLRGGTRLAERVVEGRWQPFAHDGRSTLYRRRIK